VPRQKLTKDSFCRSNPSDPGFAVICGNDIVVVYGAYRNRRGSAVFENPCRISCSGKRRYCHALGLRRLEDGIRLQNRASHGVNAATTGFSRHMYALETITRDISSDCKSTYANAGHRYRQDGSAAVNVSSFGEKCARLG
jgi:hypothetical protein